MARGHHLRGLPRGPFGSSCAGDKRLDSSSPSTTPRRTKATPTALTSWPRRRMGQLSPGRGRPQSARPSHQHHYTDTKELTLIGGCHHCNFLRRAFLLTSSTFLFFLSSLLLSQSWSLSSDWRSLLIFLSFLCNTSSSINQSIAGFFSSSIAGFFSVDRFSFSGPESSSVGLSAVSSVDFEPEPSESFRKRWCNGKE